MRPEWTESIWQRAKREAGASFHGIRFIVAVVVVDAVATFAAVLLSADHGVLVQAVLAASATLGGTLVVGLAVVGAVWVTAPVRQRDEARATLAAFVAPHEFPDVVLDAQSLIEEAVHNENFPRRVLLPVLATNRQTDFGISLHFTLVVPLEGQGMRLFARGDEAPELPVDLAPMKSRSFKLSFPVWSEIAAVIDDARRDADPLSRPVAYRLYVKELISDSTIEFEVPGHFRRPTA